MAYLHQYTKKFPSPNLSPKSSTHNPEKSCDNVVLEVTQDRRNKPSPLRKTEGERSVIEPGFDPPVYCSLITGSSSERERETWRDSEKRKGMATDSGRRRQKTKTKENEEVRRKARSGE